MTIASEGLVMPPRRRRQVTPESAERTAQVVELRGQGEPFDRIGRRFGVSGERARQLYRRALDVRVSDAVDAVRDQLSDLGDVAISELLSLALDEQTSRRTKVEAWNSARGWASELARIHGVYDRAQVDDGMRDWSPPADLVARVDRARAALRQRAES